ncbi:MAG: Tim44/TimA family putative adaptor protein [Alphaproteobacteria bacterium]
MAFLEIIVLAVLLAFIVVKLRSVLGRRTGEERQRPNPYLDRGDANDRDDDDDTVVTLPRARVRSEEPAVEDRMSRFAPKGSPLSQGLIDIQMADRTFDPDQFLDGAKSAYEMIVTAFAAGSRTDLEPLLSTDVMQDFEAVIAARESRSETVEFQFVGLQSAKFTEAALEDRVAEITLKFVSEVISVTKNVDGAIIEGDPTSVRTVTDTWTFARDTRSTDPNWELVSTAG